MQIYKRCTSCGTEYQDSISGLGAMRNTPVCQCGSQDFEASMNAVPEWWTGNPQPARFVLEGGALPGVRLPAIAKD